MPKEKRQQDAGATGQNASLPDKYNSRNSRFVKRDSAIKMWASWRRKNQNRQFPQIHPEGKGRA
jgi:hypothetical protein